VNSGDTQYDKSDFMGNLKLTFLLSFKSIIKGNRWALVMIILVMSLSFANSILTPSIISGVTKALNQQQINTIYGNIVIDPQKTEYYINDVSNILAQVQLYPGVAGVAPHLNSNALFEVNWTDKTNPADSGESGNWPVIGIDPESESQVTTIHNSLIMGSYLVPGDTDSILLGVEIAGGTGASTSSFLTLGGVNVGDKVRLTYPNSIQKEYVVKGIFRSREGQADSSAYVTGSEMAAVLGQDFFSNRASQILVKIDKASDEQKIIAGLQTLSISGTIRSWQEYGGSIGGVVSSFDSIAGLISGIGLVVAAIVMFIVIYINVLGRKRQIGILRAIGVKRNVIMFSYVIQSMFYAILGILFGGLLFGYVILPYFQAHPLDLSIGLVSLNTDPIMITTAVWGIVIAAILAGIIPVMNITHQSIIKAIWGT
jgi:putative ABC transport system permease protein